MTRRRRLLLCLVPLALVLAACGGAAPAANDPAGVARQAMSLVAAKDVAGLTGLTCAAQQGSILEDFTAGLADTGMSPEQALAAVTIDTSKLTIGAVTESGDTASVALGGTMSISFDEAQMREIVKTQLQNEGQPTDDATVDMAMGFIGAMNGQQIPMDGQTMDLVRENGAWKICDE